MQLIYSSKLKPIAIGLMVAGTSAIIYNEIDLYTSINKSDSDKFFDNDNINISKYTDEIEANSYNNLINRIQFEDYLMKWQRETAFCSFVKDIVENVNFQNIIAMKESAVPFIIAEINRKPSVLVWALNIIYNTKITTEPQATVKDACKLWVKKWKSTQ